MIRRVALRRKPRPASENVSPTVALAVFTRDGYCLAPLLGAETECRGRSTFEHVKDELRAGKRATSDERHGVALCEGHTEPGRKAGYQWNTAKANRALVRAYLRLVPGRSRETAAILALRECGVSCGHVDERRHDCPSCAARPLPARSAGAHVRMPQP